MPVSSTRYRRRGGAHPTSGNRAVEHDLACKIKRALVLLQKDAGLIDRDVARGLRISAAPVGRIRTRYGPKGLHGALEERLHLHRCIRAAPHLFILFRLKWY